MTNEEFKEKAIIKHGNKYNYDKCNFINGGIKVIITCPVHGDFSVRAKNHIGKQSNGCYQCGQISTRSKQSMSLKKFIIKANEVHNNKYTYEFVDYENIHTKVSIYCSEHGIFNQTPNRHLVGNGCPSCNFANRPLKSVSEKDIVNKFNKIHNNYYNYSKFIYKGVKNKIIVICPKHGDFECGISNHNKGRGCSKCKRSKGELAITIWLNSNNILFEAQKKFPNCKNIRPLPFDFYVSQYNLLIEYHGEQHFKQLTGNWKNHDLKYRQNLDRIKRNFALNNFNYLEITYKDNINEKLNEYFKNKKEKISNN